jgi:hypothetical protein
MIDAVTGKHEWRAVGRTAIEQTDIASPATRQQPPPSLQS